MYKDIKGGNVRVYTEPHSICAGKLIDWWQTHKHTLIEWRTSLYLMQKSIKYIFMKIHGLKWGSRGGSGAWARIMDNKIYKVTDGEAASIKSA